MSTQKDLFEVSIDGFDLQVQVYVEPWSKEIEITELFDMDDNELEEEFYNLLMDDYYDEILSDIMDQLITMGEF